MEERDNKTIMCSVLFLDIVEYSKKSVSGQISLKDRFNSYLSAAIREVPITDRIILDTGDGAAINFLGDVEDALKAALSLRESLLNEDVNVDHPLLVRMGINLGPVRLVRDINGQPNIVGDGINVAQRVMGFADAAQILVSRSYYDAVSRLSPQYAGMFHYQGSRTDKHVREHEVYAIGYPGDKTIQRGKTQSAVTEYSDKTLLERTKSIWRFAASRLDDLVERLVNGFRKAGIKQRVMYVGIVAIPLIFFIVLLINQIRHDKISAVQNSKGGQAASKIQPGSAVAIVDVTQPGSAVAPVSTIPDRKVQEGIHEKSKDVKKQKAQKTVNGKKPEKRKEKNKHPAKQVVTETRKGAGTLVSIISINCMGAEVFVDGTRKGRISSTPFTVQVSPGKHAVIINHAKGVHSQDIVFDAGKTVHLNPGFCNQ